MNCCLSEMFRRRHPPTTIPPRRHHDVWRPARQRSYSHVRAALVGSSSGSYWALWFCKTVRCARPPVLHTQPSLGTIVCVRVCGQSLARSGHERRAPGATWGPFFVCGPEPTSLARAGCTPGYTGGLMERRFLTSWCWARWWRSPAASLQHAGVGTRGWGPGGWGHSAGPGGDVVPGRAPHRAGALPGVPHGGRHRALRTQTYARRKATHTSMASAAAGRRMPPWMPMTAACPMWARGGCRRTRLTPSRPGPRRVLPRAIPPMRRSSRPVGSAAAGGRDAGSGHGLHAHVHAHGRLPCSWWIRRSRRTGTSSATTSPGVRSQVHHVLLYVATKASAQSKDDGQAGPGWTCFGGPGHQLTADAGRVGSGLGGHAVPGGHRHPAQGGRGAGDADPLQHADRRPRRTAR